MLIWCSRNISYYHRIIFFFFLGLFYEKQHIQLKIKFIPQYLDGGKRMSLYCA